MPEEIHFWYDKEHPMVEEGFLVSINGRVHDALEKICYRGKFDIQIQNNDTTR
jgi:hypothetical protein